MNTRATASLSLALLLVLGCGSGNDTWELDHVDTMPAEIEVFAATRFRCGTVECQLLGVAESQDPGTRVEALEFTKEWFKGVGNYIGIYNGDHPLQRDDGTCVVWVRGYDSSLSCLNLELVRAGLVDVEYSQWKDYAFTEPGMSGDVWLDWQGELKEAQAERRQN